MATKRLSMRRTREYLEPSSGALTATATPSSGDIYRRGSLAAGSPCVKSTAPARRVSSTTRARCAASPIPSRASGSRWRSSSCARGVGLHLRRGDGDPAAPRSDRAGT